MEQDEDLPLEGQIDNLDAALTALIDVLVKKGVMTQKEYDDQLDSMYEE